MKKIIITCLSLCVLAVGAKLVYSNLGKSLRPGISRECPDCNVVFILIDTLRADHLPFYGHKANTAPYLNSLSEKSTVFERAFSASSWTAPATASIFTSLYPSQHGVITGFMATNRLKKDFPDMVLNRIPDSIPVMGEYMKKAGFQTIGVADNLNIGKEIGFDRGFDNFRKFLDETADTVNKQAIEFLDQRPADSKNPYFLYLHYMDPHSRYMRREPFYGECMAKTKKTKIQNVLCSYDSEISFVDRHIEELADRYKWLENSIIIVTADHGEEFWDHGDKGHGQSLYKELIHVPLMIYHPQIPKRRIAEDVHTMDLLPTLTDIKGITKNKDWQGRSLVPLLEGKDSWDDQRVLVSERLRVKEKPAPEFRSIIYDNHHFIQTEKDKVVLKKELFNLDTDFSEKINMCSANPEMAEEYEHILNVDHKFTPVSGNTEIKIEMDKELDKQLRSLGYF